MKKKKNRFLLFCFSFLPGAGEMYYGFMKTGVSLLALFAFTIMLTMYTNMGVLGLATMVIWVYGFFHANNLGSLSDEEFYRLEDAYLFGMKENELDSVKDFVMGKYHKVFAAFLILVGVSMLWQTFCRFLRHIVGSEFYYKYFAVFTQAIGTDVPRLLVSILIIWIGIRLIMGKKKELDILDGKEEKAWRAENGQQPAGGRWQTENGERPAGSVWHAESEPQMNSAGQPAGSAQNTPGTPQITDGLRED